jgi:hypothetical protein
MSRELWGVVIGAAAGMIMPMVMLIRDSRRWRIEQRLAFLRDKRQRLEGAFRAAAVSLAEGMKENSYSIDTLMEYTHLFPDNVRSAIDKCLDGTVRPPDDMKMHYMDIVAEMKRSLAAIEQDIEATIGGGQRP